MVLALVLLLLAKSVAVPVWVMVSIFIVWLAKDFAVYPIVRDAYETNVKTGAESMISKRGVTEARLAPEGYVKIEGELWRAQARDANQPIPQKRMVRVTGARSLTLIVEEIQDESD